MPLRTGTPEKDFEISSILAMGIFIGETVAMPEIA